MTIHIVCAQTICAQTTWRSVIAMWSTEYDIETEAPAERIWEAWEDVASWPAWNGDLERAELSGAFAPGSTITMHSPEQDPIELRIVQAERPSVFVDRADLGDIAVTTTHRTERLADGRTRIVYAMEISGPAADTVGPELGPAISGDFPQVLAALVRRAEG